MKSQFFITINGIDFPVVFSYAALRRVAQMWSLKGSSQVPAHLAAGNVDEVDGCVDLAFAAIVTSGVAGCDAVTVDQVGDYLLKNQGAIQGVVLALQDAFPRAEAVEEAGEGKPTAAAPQS